MRLIDADEILQDAEKIFLVASLVLSDKQEKAVITATCQIIADTVKKAPTVDAVPVKHGEWIREGRGYCRCSACNKEYEEEFLYYEKTKIAYCPFCGAKMDRCN